MGVATTRKYKASFRGDKNVYGDYDYGDYDWLCNHMNILKTNELHIKMNCIVCELYHNKLYHNK